jgi:multidrug efflux pump subunit AcrA (membrane-fusion protein)
MRCRSLRAWLLTGLLVWPATAGWAQPPAAPKTRYQQGPTNPFVIGVAGQGRIVPAGGLLRRGVPIGAAGPGTVAQLLVTPGEAVDAGQLLAVLSTRETLRAQADAAQQEAAAAAAALEQAKAAAAQADAAFDAQLLDLEGKAVAAELAAHQAAVNSSLALEQAKREEQAAQAALAAAQELQQMVQLVGNTTVAVGQAQVDAIGRYSDNQRKIAQAGVEEAKAGALKANADLANQIEQLQAQADLAHGRVKQAEANLVVEPAPEDAAQWAPVQVEAHSARAIYEVQKNLRDMVKAEDAASVAAAQARLAAAQASAAAAQAQVATGEIRAPYAGRVLSVLVHIGEMVGPDGVFDFGDTRDMFVDVEIAYDNVTGVHLGQKAVISCDALPDNYTGEVVDISPMVGTNRLENINPAVFTDSRVVMVKVHLDKPDVFANLVNGQVTVRMEP